MRLLLLFAAILVAGVFTHDQEEESEISLCVEHKNPFAYAHCIKKRDTGCQNGAFCGNCNGNSCQSCEGNSCKTSCNGAGCNQCPNGSCCNGQNCNVCSGRNCCSGSSCNSCVNTCNQGCSTPACRNTCVQTCQGNSCCDRSQCFNSCRNQCFGDHCYENCFKQCPCSKTCDNTHDPINPPGVNISIPTPQPPQKANQTIVVVNKPSNHNPINITTVVNLRNYINNKNVINTPINISNVNHNHIASKNSSSAKPPGDHIIQDPKCCIVVYPIHCYDIAVAPYKKCVEKREKKCGEICTSVVVHIIHVPGKDRLVPYPVQRPPIVVSQPYPVPYPVEKRYPVYVPGPSVCAGGGCGSTCAGGVGGIGGVGGVGGIGGVGGTQCGTQCGITGGCGYRRVCHYINRFPWISCGHYGAQNCGSCYVCGGQYNPGYCSKQSGCAGLCRGHIVNFGNNWQNDILRYAPTYNTPIPDVTLPAAQLVQQPQSLQQPIDLQQQAYAAQQPIGLGVQQQYVQQPADLGVPQQYVQQLADPGAQQQFAAMQQQPIEYQQGGVQQQYVMQQPIEYQQGGNQQQYVMQQPIEYQQGGYQQQYVVQQPHGDVQQQFAQNQHPVQQMMQQPVQMQEQPSGFGGK